MKRTVIRLEVRIPSHSRVCDDAMDSAFRGFLEPRGIEHHRSIVAVKEIERFSRSRDLADRKRDFDRSN